MSIIITGEGGGRVRPRWMGALLVLTLGTALVACGDDGDSGDSGILRLGVFPNVTHAPGLVGIEDGYLQEAVGEDVEIEVLYFNAGGEAIEAMFGGEIDLTFIGPNPAINGFHQSDGEDVRLIGGSTSGGAFLVVREGIESAEDLEGTTLASPALGNTQDVAMRAWLEEQGYETDETGGGDVAITPLENPNILQAFESGELDGAWVPEPWATRLIDEAGGQVLVDEADLWPDGQFVTTHVLANTAYLENNPAVVRNFLDGHLDALDHVNENPEEAQQTVQDSIEDVSGSRLDEEIITTAWDNLEFTHDPIASSLAKSAEDATAAGLLDPVDLDGIYDLTILNELLGERGEDEVEGL